LKTISKGLILALVIQFTLFLPLQSVWLWSSAEKAKAVIEPSVTMSQPMYTSQTKDKINFNITINGSVNQVGASKDSEATSLPSAKLVTHPSGSYVFTTFDLPIGFTAFNIDGFTTPKLYLIVFDDQLVNVAFRNENLPQAIVPSGKGLAVFTQPWDVSFWARTNQINQSDINNNKYWQTMMWYADSNHVPRPVSTRLLESDMPTVCQRTERNWENLKKSIRDLFHPAPGSVNGQSQNHNWEVTTGVTAEIFGASYLDVMSSLKAWVMRQGYYLANIDGVNVQGIIHAVETETLKPTQDGYQSLDNIIQYGYLLDQDLQMLIDNNANCGSHDVKFKMFKWNEALENDNNIFTSLPLMREYVKEIVEVAKKYFEELSSPVVTAGELGEDICGNPGTNLVSGKIFQWLFCELANIIHGIAAKIMTKATQWLTDSIGVDININFKEPEKSNYQFDSGGGGESTNPGTGTDNGGTGGETPAPRTAAPMNISGKINFLDEVEFNTARDAGAIAVRVKNGQGTSEIINVGASFTNWNWDNNETGSVECRFTTTENIPTDWRVVTIYGTRGSERVFRIMLTYPPDPANFVVQHGWAD